MWWENKINHRKNWWYYIIYNNLKDTIDGAKLIIESLIKTSTVNIVNIQLKSANLY